MHALFGQILARTNYPVPRSGGKTLLALRCSRIMAKKKHGQSNYTSPRSSAPPHPSTCPSLSVLSILSTIAAASQTVDGSPLPLPTQPPSFLCPFIEHDKRAVLSTAASSSTAPSASPTLITSNKCQLADKYVQGSDGLWRKTDDWTLFGSTVRSFCRHPSFRSCVYLVFLNIFCHCIAIYSTRYRLTDQPP